MSSLRMLDVAIGMTFLFLLISLICTALNEILEALLKNRATDLEQGIREMLGGSTTDPQSMAPDADPTLDQQRLTPQKVVSALYSHPLIYSLFAGPHRHKVRLWRRNLPSYIPARTFALALMDLVLPATVGRPSGTASTTNASTDMPTLDKPAVEGNNGAAGQAPVGQEVGNAEPNNVKPNNDAAPNDAAQTPQPPVPFTPLRQAVAQIQNYKLRGALLPLLDAAGDDVTVARENIENWFNTSMDRVAGWYKRRAQTILTGIGFAVAVLLNADAVAVFKSLYNNPAQRELVVQAAASYTQQNTSVGDSTNATAVVDSALTQLDALNLPIGWSWDSTQVAKGQTSNRNLAVPYQHYGEKGWWGAWSSKLLGWLITGIAVSLGAPFWFDLLNKFMVIRSTVKPHEKSPEESSEDRQTSKAGK